MKYPERYIRAEYTDKTIRVYQAYSDAIANSALKAGTFASPPFNMTRMTWIKPSFLWMMYRAGWGRKDEGQKRILAIDITRDGFEWALAHSCLSHFEPAVHRSHDDWMHQRDASPVRIQWDPERDINLSRLEYRSIQIGISGEAVRNYVTEWIVRIQDITSLANELATPETRDDLRLPQEEPYELPDAIAKRIGIGL